jgi:DNA-binding HxlR family transcriptional regulator
MRIIEVIILAQPKAEIQTEVQDVLTFKPERIKIISDRKIIDIMRDPHHMPIIKALRKGPMTVRELEKAYANEAKDSEEVEAKSDKTIYRYLKVLEKAGAVVPAGQRVVIGKTATETLFSRSAEIFMTLATETDYWDCDEGKDLAKKMAPMLSKVYGDRKIDISCLTKFMNHLEKESNKQLLGLFEGADEEMVDLITSIDWHYKDKVLGYVSSFSIILNSPEIYEKLRACFK